MAKLGTFCSECVFYNDNKCDNGIIEKFEAAGAEVIKTENETTIDRVCVYRRLEDWIQDKSPEEVNKVLADEVYISGSVIVLGKDLDSIEKCLTKLASVPKIKRFKIIVAHKKEMKASDVREICEKILNDIDYICVKVFDDINSSFIMDEGFKRAKNGYVFFIESDKDFDDIMIEEVNKAINEKLDRFIYIKPVDETMHGAVCFSIIYKYLKGNKFYNITKKLEEYTNEQECQYLLKTWNDVYENNLN